MTDQTPQYEALARKWRPQTFDDVLAQPQVTQTLKNAIISGRVHHAYLFCGPRGTGKTTTARILAKALNCAQGPTATPCNNCDSCRAITQGSSLDVLEIDAASNTGVDDVRELRESSRYVPAGSRFKIYIIDEVHRLSPSAFDALLKTLEEPPPTVKFIFATTEPQAVPATVRSRALLFDFHLIPHDTLRAHLERVAAAEGMTIDSESLNILAAEAAGSLRDSQSLLDQIASYAGGAITAAITNEALGLVATGVLFGFTDALAAGDVPQALGTIAEVSRAGRDFGQFMRQLNEHLKRLVFAGSLGDAFTDDALDPDGCGRYREAAGRLSENDWLRLLLMSVDVGSRIRKSAQPRLELEMFAMRAAQMDRAIDIRRLLDQIDSGRMSGNLFGGGGGGSRMGSNPRPAVTRSDSAPAPPGPAPEMPKSGRSHGAPSTPSAAGTTTPAATGQDRIDFAPILDGICEQRPTLRAILGTASLVRIGPGALELDVYNGSTFHSKQLAHKPIRDLIHAEIARALGSGLRVSIHVKEGPMPSDAVPVRATGPATATASAPAVGVEADHNLQEIMRRFDGEIVN